MAKLSIFRARRRSAAEKRALVPLHRQIGAVDRLSRHKYLQDFADAFRTYQRVISRPALLRFCAEADTLLVSDFHALDSCQIFVADLLGDLANSQQRPIVLLLEAVFTRDQHIVDEWQAGSISDRELRQRLRFKADWGYAWEPFLRLLTTARGLRIPIYGADCPPRGNMRRIGERDRHAADTVARARQSHADAIIVVVFGESHLAPNHLPQEIRSLLPSERVRTVLQNVDSLYFRSAGELRQRVEALQASSDVAAVFNATPVEKWQRYRFWISRWQAEPRDRVDFAPALYDLIDALLDFLHISRYSEDESAPRYFIDCYPEVASLRSLGAAHSLLRRKLLSERRRRQVLADLAEQGSAYIPELNLIVIYELRMQAAARAVTSFIHHACRDFSETTFEWPDGENRAEPFYRAVVERAVLAFGARILHPSHPLSEEEDLFALYAEPREEVEANTLIPYREYMRILDCVMLHRDYEMHSRHYAMRPALLQEFLAGSVSYLELLADYLGNLLGADLYRAYLSGRLSAPSARPFFFRKLSTGAAREFYFQVVRRVRQRRADLAA